MVRKIYAGFCCWHEGCQKVVEIVRKKIVRAGDSRLRVAAGGDFGGGNVTAACRSVGSVRHISPVTEFPL